MPEVRRDTETRGSETKVEAPASEFIESFMASMPRSYRLQYGEQTIREHAGIAWRRGTTPVHLELWRDGSTDSACLCVVTDDRPGLLALVTAAIAAHSLDIISAKVFGRSRRWQADEAVDFFWVRAPNARGPVGVEARQLAAIGETLASLLRDELEVASLTPRRTPTARPGPPCLAQVRFDDEATTDLLVVDADDQVGLLSTITAAVASQGAHIVWSAVVTVAGRAHDEFRVEREPGRRLSPEEKRAIVDAVAAALH